MKRLLIIALLSSCTNTSTDTITSSLCTVDDPGCSTYWFALETRSQYGSSEGRMRCSPIHTDQGSFYTTCTISLGSVVLFSCVFDYSVDEDENSMINNVNCH